MIQAEEIIPGSAVPVERKVLIYTTLIKMATELIINSSIEFFYYWSAIFFIDL